MGVSGRQRPFDFTSSYSSVSSACLSDARNSDWLAFAQAVAIPPLCGPKRLLRSQSSEELRVSTWLALVNALLQFGENLFAPKRRVVVILAGCS